jgi:hypothetical protein
MNQRASVGITGRSDNPAEDDDDAIAFERLHEFAIDDSDGASQDWRSCRQRGP